MNLRLRKDGAMNAPRRTGLERETVPWTSTTVALGILALIAGVMLTAVLRYSADDSLKIWAALGPLVGIVTGAFVTYFFSRQAVDQAEDKAETHARIAAQLEQQVENTTSAAAESWRSLSARVANAQLAVASVMAELPPDRARRLMDDHQLAQLFEPSPPPPVPR